MEHETNYKEKILENWKEIESVEKLAQYETGDPEAGFGANRFWFGKEGRHIIIPVMYRGKKGKKDNQVFTDSYKEMLVYAKYCPFTGKALYKDLEK
jgi:hypothetical protein